MESTTPELPDDPGADATPEPTPIGRRRVTASYLLRLNFHEGELTLPDLQERLVREFVENDPSITYAERTDK